MSRVLRRRDFLLAKLFAGAALVLLAVLAWSVWPYWELAGRFSSLPTERPSRVWGRAFAVAPGDALEPKALVERLDEAGYRPVGSDGLVPGTYRAGADRVVASLRRRHLPGGVAPAALLDVAFAGGRVRGMTLDERPAARAELDPERLASLFGPELLDRVPVPISAIPSDVVRAVLAAEDAGFFEHPGVSPSGILRAMWSNLRAGAVRQGGSTITQQLAKNLYLTHERRMSRKVREAMLAVFLEARYSKEQILEAYLNQIFWGRSGSANLIGIGAAAEGWFGRPASELDLADGALLAAMIPAPADYSPVRKPEVARERRDRVLDRMVDLDWVTAEAAEAAKARPLPAAQPPRTRRVAPYFVDAALDEARRRWGISELGDAGYDLHTTLDPWEQERAERAVEEGLGKLIEQNRRVRRKEDSFQAALVSIEPSNGAVRAYVGGRDYGASQFDRAGSAKRQAGSAFKPLVYATAFELGRATPATLLEDAPFTIESGGEAWSPGNDDDEFHGWVTARTALERSLNVPTARLALQIGPEAVVESARRFGITTRLRPFPSVALGAFEVTPVELATVYATLANRGTRPPVHLVEAVSRADGVPLEGQPLPPPREAVSPQTAYVVTALLQGVVDYGTGRGARAMGLSDPVAGKTGTTNRRRDNWFGGFAPERAALVWVGFDDDSPTPFSGSRAALPIWTSFFLATRPPGGYSRPEAPEGVRVVLIDPETGELATDRCPEVLAEVFPADRIPASVCHLHGGWRAQPIDPGLRAERDEKRGTLRSWLKRLFGRDRDDEGDSPRRRPGESPTGPPP